MPSKLMTFEWAVGRVSSADEAFAAAGIRSDIREMDFPFWRIGRGALTVEVEVDLCTGSVLDQPELVQALDRKYRRI
jgi:hypothetical protein